MVKQMLKSVVWVKQMVKKCGKGRMDCKVWFGQAKDCGKELRLIKGNI